jgi:hypothetical protein
MVAVLPDPKDKRQGRRMTAHAGIPFSPIHFS